MSEETENDAALDETAAEQSAQEQPPRRGRGRPKKSESPGMTKEQALKAATPRELIDALIARIGRVEAVRGVKWPPMRVLAQELREHRNSFANHPAMDEDRT